MSAIGDALDAMKTVIEGVTGIETVYRRVPETMPPDVQLPAVLMRPMPSNVNMIRPRTRAVVWPVDLWLLGEKRDGDIDGGISRVEGVPELIIAALDLNSTLNGTLDRTIEYDSPAFGSEDGGAFGVIGAEGQQWVGTTIHTILTITRVGGFAA